MIRLPAEWEPQEAVLLTWPHHNTDWAPIIDEVDSLYFSLSYEIVNHTNLIIAATPERHEKIKSHLQETCSKQPFKHFVYSVESDDTWARDHGPISVKEYTKTNDFFSNLHQIETLKLLDFTFNAWGNKYTNTLDNRLTQTLYAQKAFGEAPLVKIDFVLEGGAIESNGAGVLLTTEQCLLNPNRNAHMSKSDIEKVMHDELGIKKILWLKHGHLVGDDTDSHIDTLARFAPNNVITYVSCDDRQDEHFHALNLMKEELSQFQTDCGEPFELISLPLPSAIYDEKSNRLPATYANYLITNNAVIVPTYDDEKDKIALNQIAKAFPNRSIIGFDCRTLIKQHGSLHCITMQIPTATPFSLTKKEIF